MIDVDRMLAEFDAGARVVLQRVGKGRAAPDVVQDLCLRARLACEISGDDVWRPAPPLIRVLDGRTGVSFEGWNERREELGTRQSPLVVLLDVASSRRLQHEAHHVVPWAGTIWLAAPPTVRYTATDEERGVGSRLLARRLEDEGIRAQVVGKSVGVDMASGRLFVPVGDDDALNLARRELDEGLLHVERIWS